jgi:hypothetical protein
VVATLRQVPGLGGNGPVRGRDHRVPVAVRPVFEEIAGIADNFSRQHLDAEYAADLPLRERAAGRPRHRRARRMTVPARH